VSRRHDVKGCSQPAAFVGGELRAHRLEVGDILVAETLALVEERDFGRENGEVRGARAPRERLNRSVDLWSSRNNESSPSVSSIIS
jgi:hypothetical protein